MWADESLWVKLCSKASLVRRILHTTAIISRRADSTQRKTNQMAIVYWWNRQWTSLITVFACWQLFCSEPAFPQNSTMHLKHHLKFPVLNSRSEKHHCQTKKRSQWNQLIFIPAVHSRRDVKVSFSAGDWKDMAGRWLQRVGWEVGLQTNCPKHGRVIKRPAEQSDSHSSEKTLLIATP